MQRQKIAPIVDVPLLLEMETVFGQECNSKFNGVEYRFNVIHQGNPCFIYLPESGRDALASLRPDVGETVELLKQKKGTAFVYRAQRLSDAQEIHARLPSPPPAAIAPVEPRANGANGANVRTIAPRAPQPPATTGANALAPQLPTVAMRLASCLCASLDAWEETRAYAARKGATLDYTSEDVRATGLTVYISQEKNAR
ncbi:hypothetical protein [Nevskia soli]|uniref:hypothetical protein n=1 Tax=Nevskia soli TaxID=418856 RepID=UPI0015D78A32|nr:hypothetical protein [Nevskia soli]